MGDFGLNFRGGSLKGSPSIPHRRPPKPIYLPTTTHTHLCDGTSDRNFLLLKDRGITQHLPLQHESQSILDIVYANQAIYLLLSDGSNHHDLTQVTF